MTTIRWSKSVAVGGAKIRWAKSIAQGPGAAPRIRWTKSVAQGVTNPSLQTISDITAEAGTVVTITVNKTANSPVPTGYTWRQVPNGAPTASFSDGGNSITLTVPASPNGIDVVFGVVAYNGAATSTEVTATIHTYPHQYWLIKSDGTFEAMGKPVAL